MSDTSEIQGQGIYCGDRLTCVNLPDLLSHPPFWRSPRVDEPHLPVCGSDSVSLPAD